MADGTQKLSPAERATQVIAAFNGSDTARATAAAVVRSAMLTLDTEFLLALVDAREALPAQSSRSAENYVRATMAQIWKLDQKRTREGVTVLAGEAFNPAPNLTVHAAKFGGRRSIQEKVERERGEQEKALAAMIAALKNVRAVGASAVNDDGKFLPIGDAERGLEAIIKALAECEYDVTK